MAGFLKKFFTKDEPSVDSKLVEKTIEENPVQDTRVANEEVFLDRAEEWLKNQEKQFLDHANLEEELVDYVKNIRECAKRINLQIDTWIDGLDLSALHYTTVGEVNLLFSDAQTIVKLIHTKQPLNLENITRFNLAVQEKVRKLTEKIETSSFGEELGSLLSLNAGEEKGYQQNPLWVDLQHLNNLREEFNLKFQSSSWQKLGMLQRLLNHLTLSEKSLHQLHARLRINQQHLQQALESRDDKERDLSVLKHEPDFEELQDREDKLELLEPQLEQAKQKVLVFFSPLQPYLQQLLKVDPDNSVLEDYLSSYLTAFYEDEEMIILPIVRKLRLCLEDQRVKVEPEDLALVLDRVEQANSGKLRELHAEYGRVRKQYQEAEQSTNRALSMKYEDTKYRLNHFEEEISRLKKQIKELEEQIKNTQESQRKAKEKFELFAKEYLGKDVEVII
jgi:predicted  nucleic acid-binding Zn-ribbon protein